MSSFIEGVFESVFVRLYDDECTGDVLFAESW